MAMIRLCLPDRCDGEVALAGEMPGKCRDAVRASKLLYERAWHADERTGLALEASLQAGLIGTANQMEAVKANFEKRLPIFEPAADLSHK